MLNHTSGLPDFAQLSLTEAVMEEPGAVDPERLVGVATLQPLSFVPGEDFAYTNTGFVVLGMIIEEATGTSLEQNLDTRIFVPLRMSSTSLRRERR